MDWADPSSYRLSRSDARSICAVLKAETRPGSDEEFETLMRDFAYQVRDVEVGCDSYVVTRMIGSRNHFAMHAQFTSMEAFERHADTLHMAKAMPRLSALLAAPISMEIFLAV
ncbi:MAG TPA: antibiotic biosynthesis monooxygenase [Vitreimonas sp.]|uniref:putative quinol monooxygenase n=1 Tax=Vitreimonas sp. TaxID=3069702 RepID=UPI002D3A760A|nr:antibiotic biosynthesis monooxygenase [Vitreimonas sp.]HYD86104.1 antibiotic biosynthesis monooxygenase [Vitreimonas sp.]